jgi:hypothetical protein
MRCKKLAQEFWLRCGKTKAFQGSDEFLNLTLN